MPISPHLFMGGFWKACPWLSQGAEQHTTLQSFQHAHPPKNLFYSAVSLTIPMRLQASKDRQQAPHLRMASSVAGPSTAPPSLSAAGPADHALACAAFCARTLRGAS